MEFSNKRIALILASMTVIILVLLVFNPQDKINEPDDIISESTDFEESESVSSDQTISVKAKNVKGKLIAPSGASVEFEADELIGEAFKKLVENKKTEITWDEMKESFESSWVGISVYPNLNLKTDKYNIGASLEKNISDYCEIGPFLNFEIEKIKLLNLGGKVGCNIGKIGAESFPNYNFETEKLNIGFSIYYNAGVCHAGVFSNHNASNFEASNIGLSLGCRIFGL